VTSVLGEPDPETAVRSMLRLPQWQRGLLYARTLLRCGWTDRQIVDALATSCPTAPNPNVPPEWWRACLVALLDIAKEREAIVSSRKEVQMRSVFEVSDSWGERHGYVAENSQQALQHHESLGYEQEDTGPWEVRVIPPEELVAIGFEDALLESEVPEGWTEREAATGTDEPCYQSVTAPAAAWAAKADTVPQFLFTTAY
jgi:hypothetical protein